MIKYVSILTAILVTGAANAGTFKFNPTADARVTAIYPDQNFGSDPALRVNSDPSKISYLKFAVSGISGAKVSSAKLRLYVTEASVNAPKIVSASSSWAEGIITFNNKPSVSSTVLADLASVSASTWVEYNVTSAIAADGTFSFALLATSTDQTAFASREAASKPELVIETTSTSAIAIPAGYTAVDALNKGMKCNGTADDAAALQSAMNGLSSYQALMLPAGTCVISKQVWLNDKSNVAVIGAGMSKTILKATNPMSSAFSVSDSDHVLIAGMQLWSPNTTQRGHLPDNTGFFIRRTSHSTLRGLKALNVAGAGYLLMHVSNSIVEDSENQWSWADSFHATGGSRDVTFRRNRTLYGGDDCYASIGYKDAYNYNINFFDNYCYGNSPTLGGHSGGGHGVDYAGTFGGIASGNHFEKTSCSGVKIESLRSGAGWEFWRVSQITIENNTMINNTLRQDLDQPAILLDAYFMDIDQVVVRNNLIIDPDNGLGIRGFGINGYVRDSIIQGNEIRDTKGTVKRCVSMENHTLNISVSGNTKNGVACNN
jgi:hypothetical protein